MNRKLKLAIAALLGFSAACSSVKRTAREPGDAAADSVSMTGSGGETPRIRVMYGVRFPEETVRARKHGNPSDSTVVGHERTTEDATSGATKR